MNDQPIGEEEMDSLSQAFCQQRSMRTSSAVVLCLAMLFASYPGISAAQAELRAIEETPKLMKWAGETITRGKNLYKEHEETIQGVKMLNKGRQAACQKGYGEKYNLCSSRK